MLFLLRWSFLFREFVCLSGKIMSINQQVDVMSNCYYYDKGQIIISWNVKTNLCSCKVEVLNYSSCAENGKHFKHLINVR